jgi:ethanolamine utilization protein EutA (predicted chaperonin)
MKTIGNVLAKVFDNDINNKASEHIKLQFEWPNIVEGSFSDRDCITAKKTAVHSRVSYIKNNVIFVESDHQGWIQILQTVQKKIITSINKKFPDISVNSIAFLLANDIEQTEISVDTVPAENDTQIFNCDSIKKGVYERIKDEKLRKILMRLEQRISKQ